MKPYNFTRQIVYQNEKLHNFAGVDFSSYPSEVDLKRSPDAVNVVSTRNGIIEKRTGYGVFATLPVAQPIKMIFRQEYDFYVSMVQSGLLPMGWVRTLIEVVQCGTYFYYRLDYNNDPSASWVKIKYHDSPVTPSADGKEFAQGDQKFFVVPMSESGGYKRLYFFGGGSDFVLKFKLETKYMESFLMVCLDVYQEAYIPTTSIGRSATGGGTPYENISLLTWMRKNSFVGEVGVTAYQLDATGIDGVSTDNRHGGTISNDFNGTVVAQILQAGGTYSTIVEGSGLTVNRTTGVVTFTSPPGASVVTGMDNIIIKFSKNRGFYSEKVKEILVGEDPVVDNSIYFYISKFSNYYCYGLYGLNGMSNYLFTALNNRDHWINLDTFFAPELSYSLVGSDQARIIGYSNVDKYMVIHKEKAGNEPTMFVRSVGLDSNNEIIFPLSYGLPGISALSRDSFATLRDEPMFLSHEGVYGVVTSNVTDIQSIQNRSYLIEGKLLKEASLASAKAITHDGMYFLAVGSSVYVADSRKKSYVQDDQSDSFQYDWYYWENVPVSCWHISDNRLFFGGSDGKIYRFKLQSEADAYLDVATPVSAYWTTPIMYMKNITAKKSLKNMWLRMATYDRSGVEVFYRVKGEEKLVKQQNIDILDFGDIDFTRFTFNTDTSPHVVVTNRMERQFMSIQFLMRNNNAEPFGILEIIVRYKVNSDYKGG